MKLSKLPKPWKDSHPVEEPGLTYANRKAYRHRDILSRVWAGPEDDRYLSATDGRLRPLVVQASEDVRRGPKNGTWARTDIRNVTPIQLRVVYWLLGDRIEGREEKLTWALCWKWVPASFMISALLFLPANLGGEVRNNGMYEQFRYRFWGYSYIPRNPSEAHDSTIDSPSHEIKGIERTLLRPRYLCFFTERGTEMKSIAEWEEENGSETTLQYIFVSFSSAQFCGTQDWNRLHDIAAAAAKDAGVVAYWISCSCMPDPDLAEDVYRLGDTIRGAHSLAVVLGPPVTDPTSNPSMATMLQQWGRGMWTFAEVLLSHFSRPIAIYTRGGDIQYPRFLSKRNFPAEAWTDVPCSKQLVDYDEGRITLRPLELVTLALKCLSPRADDPTAYLAGDLTYVLMSLLRRRPAVSPENTAFQEFCRLSLTNDSQHLLERRICLHPKRDQPWHQIDDFCGRNLWDISPLCQVDGIGHDDTVILGGAFAAPIRWKSFASVNVLPRPTVYRFVNRSLVRCTPIALVVSILFFPIDWVIGLIIILPTVLVQLLSPYLLASLYSARAGRAQPWLFGFEGYMDTAEIEKRIFGTRLNRLQWSTYSSPFSKHKGLDGECIGIDPALNLEFRDVINQSHAQSSNFGEAKVFTLVDTNLMTVTLFSAIRPPVALVLCGSEGGMHRALLCSYDWKSQTLYKESILRVDTIMLEKMARVDRFRLGLRRPPDETVMNYSNGEPV